MSESETKLRRCFAAVFPQLAPEQLPEASAGNVEQWDSVAHLTLVEVIQEEFHVTIEDEEAETLTSYRAWTERLR